MPKTVTRPKVQSPVEMLAERKREVEWALKETEREVRANARRAERLQAKREGLLAEVSSLDKGIEALGGMPKEAAGGA